MKKYALLLLPFLLAACMEANDPVEVNYTTMVVSKEKISLGAMMHADSAIVALACGCRFTLSVEDFSGDTNVIRYAQRDATNGAYRVAIDVSGDTLATVGNYTAKIALLSTGSKGTYRDTIYVEYARN
jgi:hypothetical protein